MSEHRQGLTKTDFIRGLQCEKMLWLDKHHPEYKVIPPYIRRRLDQGNEFGDSLMGIFGPFTEVREYVKGTDRPDKKRMAAKTRELLLAGTQVICEAAFLDENGNYCAADILRRQGDGYELYEVKNSPALSVTHITDAAYQVRLIRSCGICIHKICIIHHGEEPYVIADITEQAEAIILQIEQEMPRLMNAKYSQDEIPCKMGTHCHEPYECWYTGYCTLQASGGMEQKRCSWCHPSNLAAVQFHDLEWGRPCHDDQKLFGNLMLCMFQHGLKPGTVLARREGILDAFHQFNPAEVAAMREDDIEGLMRNPDIIRNRPKITAAVKNARAFQNIQQAHASFYGYLVGFCGEVPIHEPYGLRTESGLSRKISVDLRRQGMDWCPSEVIYSFLQTSGFLNAHEESCFLFSPEES